MTKTIEVDKQVVIILKDIYGFEMKEVALIVGYSYANVKKMLNQGRKIMSEIFDSKCALVNKQGVCHQCTELNGIFNPKQNQSEELLKIRMVREAETGKKDNLYRLRTELVEKINFCSPNGPNIRGFFMDVARYTAGEIQESSFFEVERKK